MRHETLMWGRVQDQVIRWRMLLLAAVFVAICARALLTALYVPTSVDGGWYAYPALAMAQGRDPGENQLGIEQLRAIEGGTKVRFFWDSRHNLYVLPAAAWFSTIGADFTGTRLFGATQLVVFLWISWLLLRRYGGSSLVATLCWAVLAMDTILVTAGLADLRPDTMLGIVAMLLFLLVHADVSQWSRSRYAWAAVGAAACAIVLSLIHLTAPVSLAVIGSTVLLRTWLDPSFGGRNRFLGWGALVLSGVVFVLRTPLLDILIPTRIQEPFAQDAFQALLRNFSAGPWAYLQREATRYGDYFSASNLPQGVLIGAGLAAALIWVLRRKARNDAMIPGLLLGAGAGMLVVAICSPYPRMDHALTLMPFLVLLAARMAEHWRQSELAPRVVPLLALLVAGCFGLKIAHVAYNWERMTSNGISNAKLREAFAGALAPDRQNLILGPAEIWPFIDRRRDVVILDDRTEPLVLDEQLARHVDLVVVNRDYQTYEWLQRFERANPGSQLTLLSSVGAMDAPAYVAIYEHQRAAPASQHAATP